MKIPVTTQSEKQGTEGNVMRFSDYLQVSLPAMSCLASLLILVFFLCKLLAVNSFDSEQPFQAQASLK